jgi:hypothetical protein
MANALYPLWKQELEKGTANTALTGTVKAALVDTGTYTYSAAHQFYSDLSGVTGTPSPAGGMTTKTYTAGVFNADPVTFTAVTGPSIEAIVIYIDTGAAGTSPLVAYLDTGITGLPVTPNGGDIVVSWDAGAYKIFSL